MATITIIETPYPVLADLGEGWYLVAHRNGPALANVASDRICVLESSVYSDDIPCVVRRLAVQRYRELTWPLVKERLATH